MAMKTLITVNQLVIMNRKLLNFTSQETNQVHHILKCAQQKLYKHYYIPFRHPSKMSGNAVLWVRIPAFLCRDVPFVIATVDTPAEEEGGEERGGREERGRRGKKVR